MSEIHILTEFKNGLINFMDELIDQFPREGDLVMIRIFLNDQIPIDEVMQIFVANVNKDSGKIRKMIRDRNETFFLEEDIFKFSQTKVMHFKKLWRSGSLDDEDKKVVWKWIDSFLYLADRYVRAKSG